MKSLRVLATHVMEDMGAWCAINPRRDILTIQRRCEGEGDSFLTITLPTYGKAFEQCLALGRLDANLFPSTWRVRGGFPVFLQDFLRLIFADDGVMLDEPSIQSIRSIRQLTLMFAKIEGSCSIERDAQSFTRYIQTERELHENDFVSDADRSGEFDRLARRLWGPVLNRIAERIESYSIMPKHGPGAVADGLVSNQKFDNLTWTQRLEEEFPYFMYGTSHRNPVATDAPQPVFLSPVNEIPVRVITVPKTAATSRVISLEPAHMQMMQQSLLEAFTEEIDADPLMGPIASYSSQEPNRLLAKAGSVDGSYATIDLSDASDRVRLSVVQRLLAGSSITSRAVLACRSTHADVPGLGVIPLAKFASMGSALTFPIETMVFTTIVFMAIQDGLGTAISDSLIRSMRGHVRVYGDDIIVPTRYAPLVISRLESFGLKVNYHKTFQTGRFRESCGGDYFSGYDVSVVKMRGNLPNTRREQELIERLVAFRNRLAKACLYITVAALDRHIRSLLNGVFPVLSEEAPGLGRTDETDRRDDGEKRRWNEKSQALEIRAWHIHRPLPPSPLDGYGALWKHYLRRGNFPREDGHLNFAGRPKSATMKLRYGPA